MKKPAIHPPLVEETLGIESYQLPIDSHRDRNTPSSLTFGGGGMDEGKSIIYTFVYYFEDFVKRGISNPYNS